MKTKYEKGKLYPIPPIKIDPGYYADTDGNIYDSKRKKLKTFTMKKDSNNKYLRVRVLYEGKYTIRLVHRLIAQTFLENPENKPTVNHLNGDKQNNHPENLAYATQKEQLKHAYDTGLNKNFGENCYFNKHSEEKILEIVNYLKTTDYSFAHISRLTEIDSSVVEDIYHRKRWKRLTENIEFIERPRSKFNKFKEILQNVYEFEDKIGKILPAMAIAEHILNEEYTKELEAYIHHQRSYRRYKMKREAEKNLTA